MATRVTIRDNGLGALTKRLKAFGKGLTLTVGVHASEGEATQGRMTVAEIATINEFGLGVPERSFIRDWYDTNEATNRANLSKVAAAVLRGEYTPEAGLGRLGALFQGQIQARISGGIPPPNAASTIARKGSSTPLIDTGQLRSSILWRVERL